MSSKVGLWQIDLSHWPSTLFLSIAKGPTRMHLYSGSLSRTSETETCGKLFIWKPYCRFLLRTTFHSEIQPRSKEATAVHINMDPAARFLPDGVEWNNPKTWSASNSSSLPKTLRPRSDFWGVSGFPKKRTSFQKTPSFTAIQTVSFPFCLPNLPHPSHRNSWGGKNWPCGGLRLYSFTVAFSQGGPEARAADGESPFPAAENRSSIGSKPAARKTCGSVHLATFFSESFQNALKVCKDLMFLFASTLFRNGHFNPNIVGPGLALSGFWCNDSASLEIDCMFCLFNDPGGQRKQRGNWLKGLH